MKGIELARRYFEEYGKKMLEDFPELEGKVTVGLAGEGSECFGFDDETSKDHDFEPAFCLFLDREYEEKYGFRLERAYARLPKEFMGHKRQPLSPCGGNRHGVLITEDFYIRFLGIEKMPTSLSQWFHVPSYALAEATDGEIFLEGNNLFSAIRQELLKGYPEDVRLKKISAHLALMHQSGKYNYPRCLSHGESGAAQMSLFEFVEHAVQVCFLLEKKYCPYYKWAFRALRESKLFSDLEQPLTFLLENGNDEDMVNYKIGIIEDVSSLIIAEIKKQGITSATCNNLDTHAYSVADKIKDGTLRNLHIMETGE